PRAREDRDARELDGREAGARVEDVVVAEVVAEVGRVVPGRRQEAAVELRHGEVGVGPPRMLDADLPGAAQRAELAGVQERMADAASGEDGLDAVGRVALGD